MGIPIFTESCIREYRNSLDTTKTLRENIIAQVKSYHCNKKFEKEQALKRSNIEDLTSKINTMLSNKEDQKYFDE